MFSLIQIIKCNDDDDNYVDSFIEDKLTEQ